MLHFLLDPPLDAQPGGTIVLTGQEAHHAAAVRRVRVGERVTVGDGLGAWLEGECVSVAPREVVIRTITRTHIELPGQRVVLVQALAKGDRDELAIQAATELGADEIIPWQASRSVSRWDAVKAAKGRQRWSTIVREAAKQAHRPWIPSVSALASMRDIAALAQSADVIVLEPTATASLTALPFTLERDVVLVVGPEGGISEEELTVLSGAGATPARLGATVLRTSTAGPAAIAVLSAALGRW